MLANSISFSQKNFQALTLTELYQILQLRSEVFVVEQDCVYQDIDGKDQKAFHIIGEKNEKIVAYARCFPPNFYFEEAAIGRVVVAENERKFGYGHQLLKVAIKAIQQEYNTQKIKISAQQYLTAFYEQHGFQQIGKGYLEDGIPHIAMLKE